MSTTTAYANLLHEKMISEHLVEQVESSEVEWLQVGDQRVLTLYSEAIVSDPDEPKGVMLLLPDLQAHADWPWVIHQLRTQLPELEWSTQSIQTPYLPVNQPKLTREILLDEATQRINAAINVLETKYAERKKRQTEEEGEEKSEIRVLVGHGWGAVLAANYISTLAEPFPISAVVLINLSIPLQMYELVDAGVLIEKLPDIPILDIYGYCDAEQSELDIHERKMASKKANHTYFRQIGYCTDRNFTAQYPTLIKRMLGWLKLHFEKEAVADEESSADNPAENPVPQGQAMQPNTP